MGPTPQKARNCDSASVSNHLLVNGDANVTKETQDMVSCCVKVTAHRDSVHLRGGVGSAVVSGLEF
jgi:hypothetical protein